MADKIFFVQPNEISIMHEENRFCFGLQFVVGELVYKFVCTQQQHETKTVYFSFDLTFCIATTHEHERQKKCVRKTLEKSNTEKA